MAKRGKRGRGAAGADEATKAQAAGDPGEPPSGVIDDPVEGTAQSEPDTAADPPDSASAAESFESILDKVSKEGLSPKPEPVEVEEAREQLERAVRVPLEVYVRVERGERVAKALTKDISLSGLYLAALTLPIAGPGEQVMVELTLPGVSDAVWATARVARSPSDSAFPALGLTFENLAETDRRAIEEYIENRARFLDDE